MLSTMLYKLDTNVETISGTELEMTKRGMGVFFIRCAVSAAIKNQSLSQTCFQYTTLLLLLPSLSYAVLAHFLTIYCKSPQKCVFCGKGVTDHGVAAQKIGPSSHRPN